MDVRDRSSTCLQEPLAVIAACGHQRHPKYPPESGLSLSSVFFFSLNDHPRLTACHCSPCKQLKVTTSNDLYRCILVRSNRILKDTDRKPPISRSMITSPRNDRSPKQYWAHRTCNSWLSPLLPGACCATFL